jgi:glycosyltransferase involved in cell wall biosynthesis
MGEGSVTVVFPVRDEADNLRRAIPLVQKLGPVVVVDSASTDATCAVAQQFGAEVLQFAWDGHFPKKRNWVLRNYAFTTNWVLFLDADEFISPEFVREVQAALQATAHVGFCLNFENYFMGKRLRYGDPMRKLALFRVGAGEYERIDEDSWSHLDMEVHEHPVLNGSIGQIKCPIEHNDFRGLKHYIAKHNEYSSWEAARYLRLSGRVPRSRATTRPDSAVLKSGPSDEWCQLTERQKKKYRHVCKWWFAPAYFLATYILKKGFLDGAVGFHFALMKAIYFYQIRIKIKAEAA